MVFVDAIGDAGIAVCGGMFGHEFLRHVVLHVLHKDRVAEIGGIAVKRDDFFPTSSIMVSELGLLSDRVVSSSIFNSYWARKTSSSIGSLFLILSPVTTVICATAAVAQTPKTSIRVRIFLFSFIILQKFEVYDSHAAKLSFSFLLAGRKLLLKYYAV